MLCSKNDNLSKLSFLGSIVLDKTLTSLKAAVHACWQRSILHLRYEFSQLECPTELDHDVASRLFAFSLKFFVATEIDRMILEAWSDTVRIKTDVLPGCSIVEYDRTTITCLKASSSNGFDYEEDNIEHTARTRRLCTAPSV